MAVFILTLALSLCLAGGLWLAIGSKLQLSEDRAQNEVLNLAAYFIGMLPMSFVLIFFGVGA